MERPPEQAISLFGEELVQDPPLPELLAEAQRHLLELRERYGDFLPPGERFELVSAALDELETSLASVRAARERLTRIETRLTLAFEQAIVRLRTAERELNGDGPERTTRGEAGS
jgi:hypothetical protein